MPYAAWIPMPIIAAILFMVAYNMCEWRHFVEICKTAPKSDIIVLILTFVLTVVFDLVVAIEVGLLVAVILFMKRMTDVTNIRPWIEGEDVRLKKVPEKTQVFEINGPMFFATSEKLADLRAEEDIKTVIIRMRNVVSLDISALRTISDMYEGYRAKDIKVIFSHVNRQPKSVMKKAGFLDRVGEEYFKKNIDEALEFAESIGK